jgi:4-hydroxy-tetrahydrodipicolinate reductase
VNLLLLGRGKTGSLVEQVARERGHELRVMTSAENPRAAGLTPDALRGVAAVIDFTRPDSVLANIEACARAGVNMAVGTTGWYEHIPEIQVLVEEHETGLVYASNFSVGVNLFFDIAQVASRAAQHGYTARIVETHHIHKKDAPSGTAVTLGKILTGGGPLPEIESIREGEVVGDHEIILESPVDTIRLTHHAKSRRGFAEGAVVAAEWIADKKGFYEFRDTLRPLAVKR